MRIGKLWCVLLILLAVTVVNGAEKTPGIEGVVTVGGSPFRGVEVEASSLSMGAFWETSTNTSGYYLIEGMRSGPYTVLAEVNGRGCIVIPRVLVKEGERTRQDFHFEKGKRYPACEPLKAKKHP